jgi:8-oxo-dGTP diphosphatase
MLFAKDADGQTYILATQRGKGTPDPEYVGKYCLPCGYLDYDETTKQAAARELTEETGLTVPISDFIFWGYNDEPKSDKRQNITFRFIVKSPNTKEELEQLFTTANSEKDEIASIRFINIHDVALYEWAFNHDTLTLSFLQSYGVSV